MSITYSAGAGTIVTTSAKSGTVKSFTGGKVRLEDPITTGNNGNLAASPTYTGRLIWIDGGTGSGQTRFISGETLSLGDGDDADLDVSVAWDTDPDGTSTFQISYIAEDCATLAGLAFVTRSGFYEWKRELTVGTGSTAFLFLTGAPHEFRDNGSTSVGSIDVANNGRIDVGLDANGTSIFGIIGVVINGTDAEWALSCAAGGSVNFYDFTLAGTLANNHFEVVGGTHTWDSGKMQGCIYQMRLAGTMIISNWAFVGEGTSNDYVRIEASTVDIRSCVMDATNGFESLDDGLNVTHLVKDCVFVNSVGRNVRIHDDKKWRFVNPVNWVADSTAISFEIDDANWCQKMFSLNVTVVEPDGSAINNAPVRVYEGIINKNLPITQDTGGGSTVMENVLVEDYTFPASVFTAEVFGEHSLKVYKWLKTPFVAGLSPDFTTVGGIEPTVTLIDDPDIAETTQATAITAGSGIGITRPTNPTQLLSYDTGTVAFVVGDTVTGGTSGATGVVTEIAEGTTTLGRIHLETRNVTAFIAGEDLEVSAAKNAQASNPLVALDFSTHIDANALSLQINYDYWAARQAELTLVADGTTSVEWGAGEHAQVMFANGADSYRTERNVGDTDGVYISDRGAGSISYFTSDDGTQFTPPTSVTLSVTVSDAGGLLADANVYVQLGSGPFNDTDDLMRELTNGSGLATEPYNYTGDVAVTVRVRKVSYLEDISAQTITADGLTLQVALDLNPNAE